MATTYPTPGQMLRAKRKERNLSVTALSAAADISGEAILRIESDRGGCNFTTAVALCTVLGLPIEELAAAEQFHYLQHVGGTT